MARSPHDGGCWFCHDTEHTNADGESLVPVVFSTEFDCYLHLPCLELALQDPDDAEAEIMADELGEELKRYREARS